MPRVCANKGRTRKPGLPTADFAAREAQALKGLWAGHFMDQVQVNVEQSRFPNFVAHNMGIPDLLKKRTWFHASIIGPTPDCCPTDCFDRIHRQELPLEGLIVRRLDESLGG